MSALLSVQDLRVDYTTSRGPVRAVDGVSFTVHPGQTTALVGESGSGKSSLAQAVIGLLPGNGSVTGGRIDLRGSDLLGLTEREWRAVRGRRIGLVPQDPGNSLNPVATVGASVEASLRIHGSRERRANRARVLDLLERVGIDDPARRARQYPHELSGGMRQRVLIAAAIALQPELIIADEPTSALDVTVQARVLDLLDDLRVGTGAGMLLITHDLAVAAERSDALVVLRRGTVQEAGPTAEVLAHPRAAYTRALLADAPSLTRVVDRTPVLPVTAATPAAAARPRGAGGGAGGPAQRPLVQVEGLRQEFRRRGAGPLLAVDGVSFTVARGTTHAIVGESGSGKTTTGRALAGFGRPTAGSVRVGDTDVTALGSRPTSRAARAFRRTTQLVHQNPYASLDPRLSVGAIIAEPLLNFGLGNADERRAKVAHQLDVVGLPAEVATRRARELSGGQRQRVAIARALVLEPDLVVFDEAVSALDVSVQAQVLRLLARLQADLGLTYVFISHDLAVVRQISDTVSVLHRGRQVESGRVQDVFGDPRQAYTRELLAAVPGTARPRPGRTPVPTARHDPHEEARS
ncbi:peptide/nickel transport system ATP-binding protein [Kineococcus radiotolerans]|uniref:Peptide/nickel transport system ATP-binding protein n=1 Tax=Kineococcus radiotolerans TaxID=131568 RepID=A0A7W4TR28_KINRA|nr:ABC transporter ATP-binding protein [Kineococcus radiotolerans]MBB2903472.1 peptide/nickel transport system ATP-binding protein [Kineococcus radiotolerans]